MEGPITERDWKYLRSIHDEMLFALCSRINEKDVSIVTAKTNNPHKRYLQLYRHVKKSDAIVAECFNDWRRSNISRKILILRRHSLLLDSHIQNLSDSAQKWLTMVEEMERITEQGHTADTARKGACLPLIPAVMDTATI